MTHNDEPLLSDGAIVRGGFPLMQDSAQLSNLYDAATAKLKVPPHSIEAEQALLGGLTLDNTAWDQVADLVTEADFYRRDHRLIFTTVSDLAAQGMPFDVVTWPSCQ